jgi:thiol-disulfide isomerase/thioredoxin
MKAANKILMTIAGLVLLVAAGLKIHHLLTEPIISQSFWGSWEFFLLQIPLELGLGIWLVSGLFRKAGWLVAVFSFGGFIAATLQRGLIGAESCGCFGRVHVNPWITLFIIDVPLFVGLLIFRPKGYKLLPPPWPKAKHFFGVAIPTFILMAVIVPVVIFNKPPEKTEDYEVVRPEEWTSEKDTAKEWPMLKHIDIANSLRWGIAVILLYHYDCPDCREAIPYYDQLSRDLQGNQQAIQFAFIEAPPYGPEQENIIPVDTTCLTGRLDSTKKWYFTSPLVVVTMDGSVVKSWEGQAPKLEEILEAVFVDY